MIPYKSIFSKAMKERATTFKRHCVLLNLEDCVIEKDSNFIKIQRLVPEDAIYHEYTDEVIMDSPILGKVYKDTYGTEDRPHITALYGVTDENDYFQIRRMLPENFSSVTFIIGEISSFRNDDKPFDVLLLKIQSEELPKIHTFIRDNFKNELTYNEYKSHMTISYIKKGTCKELEGSCNWTGASYTGNLLKFAHADGFKLDLPLSK